MLRVTFPVGLLQCNCTILADEETREAVVVDPGDELPRILAALQEHALKTVAIVHTHAHIDHVGATAELGQATEAPAYLHPGDTFLHQGLAIQARMLGLPEPPSRPMDRELRDGQSIRFGSYELGVLHTPGHTPGSVCFEVAGQDLCLTGDTLFMQGIGRTDLPGGDTDAIVRSIRDRLYTLDGSTVVIPGHGPSTTIDLERHQNPFVRL